MHGEVLNVTQCQIQLLQTYISVVSMIINNWMCTPEQVEYCNILCTGTLFMTTTQGICLACIYSILTHSGCVCGHLCVSVDVWSGLWWSPTCSSGSWSSLLQPISSSWPPPTIMLHPDLTLPSVRPADRVYVHKQQRLYTWQLNVICQCSLEGGGESIWIWWWFERCSDFRGFCNESHSLHPTADLKLHCSDKDR